MTTTQTQLNVEMPQFLQINMVVDKNSTRNWHELTFFAGNSSPLPRLLQHYRISYCFTVVVHEDLSNLTGHYIHCGVPLLTVSFDLICHQMRYGYSKSSVYFVQRNSALASWYMCLFNSPISQRFFPKQWAVWTPQISSWVITTHCRLYSNISQILLLYKTRRYYNKFDSTKSWGYVTDVWK